MNTYSCQQLGLVTGGVPVLRIIRVYNDCFDLGYIIMIIQKYLYNASTGGIFSNKIIITVKLLDLSNLPNNIFNN